MASSAKEISDLAHGVDVHSSGKVGIGTTSPDWKFTVEGSYSNDWISRIYNTNTNGLGTLIRTDATSANNQVALGVYADSGYKMVVRSTGKVGIGTTAPADMMHIYQGSGTTVFRADVNSNSTVGLEINKTGSTTQSWKIADGVTHNGALQFYDSTNSAVRMHIDGSGRIGIGATGPVTGHKMTIKETATENASIVFTDTDDMVGAYVGMAKGNNEITTGTTNIDLVLGTAYTANTHLIANNAIGLTLKNGGNVGIGVTAPQFKLHVNKGSGNWVPTNGVVENIAGFQTNYDSAGSQILTYANLDGNWVDGTSGANSASGWLWGYQNLVRGGLVYDHRGSERMQLWSSYGALTFMTADSADGNAVPTDSNMNERLTILPGGNVGIGTTNPLGKLHVGFSGRAGVFIGSTNGGGSYLLLDGAGNGDGSGSDYAYIEHQSSGNLAFNVGNSSNTVGERMTIKPGGYVGINTTNPQRALHIHDHSATGLHITNTQSGSGANDGFSQYIRDDNQATELMVRENSYLGFGTNNTLRAKILSSGEMFWPEISNRGDLTFPICSISNAGSGGQYLHAQFQSYGGVMLHIHFRGYEYIGNSMREGSGGGYVYNTSGQQVIYAQAYSGHCVQVYQTTTNRVELVINTGSGATGNRWGSYVFFGGTDTITGDTPLTLVQYGWNSSTGRLYSS